MEGSYLLRNASVVYPKACLGMRNPYVTEKRHFGTETTLLVSGHAVTSNLAARVDHGVARWPKNRV